MRAFSGRGDLEELLGAIATGDRDALRRLYDATSAKLFGLLIRILHDREEAEDVLQDVYVTVWRRAERFDANRAGAMTWLATIARNRAIDRLRARGPLANAELIEDLQLPDDARSAEASVAASQETARLHGCLGELDGRTRDAIRTAFFEGVTYEALAERLSTPLGTVKSWIRRGLARLKDCMA